MTGSSGRGASSRRGRAGRPNRFRIHHRADDGVWGSFDLPVLVLLGAPSAWACPLCESETGERVRAGIFDADFGYNLAVTLLPFPLLLGIVTLVHFGPPWARDGSG